MHYSQLTKIGINLEGHVSGQRKVLCPRCSHTRKNSKEKCLSVNIDEGIWSCKNCGWAGHVDQKQYDVPDKRPLAESEEVYNWFALRLINRETVDHFGVTLSTEFFPQLDGKSKCIGYPYYLNGNLVNYKFKTRNKDFRMVKNALKVPFNIDAIAEHGYVIIVEGEEEVMVWHQCGYPSVISCPNGASDKNNNLEWLDHVYDKLEGKLKYIATDNDKPGLKLREDLVRRFDPSEVLLIDYPAKDANDTLKDYDKDALITLFNEAKPVPITEVTEVEDVISIIKGYRQNGYPVGSKVGMMMTDVHRSFNRGELEVTTGVPGHGKTTLHSYFQLRLSALEGWKWAIFSPEHNASLSVSRLCEQFMDKGLFEMTDAELDYALSFIKSHFFFYNTEKLTSFTVTHLLDLGVQIIRRYGVDGIILDPFTHIENNMEGDDSSSRVGAMLTKLSQYSRKHDVYVNLIAHPRKMEKRGEDYEVPRPYDIAYSNNFFNTPDMCTAVHISYSSGITSYHVQKVKLHFRGEPGVIEYQHDKKTGVYWEVGAQRIPLCKITQQQQLEI